MERERISINDCVIFPSGSQKSWGAEFFDWIAVGTVNKPVFL